MGNKRRITRLLVTLSLVAAASVFGATVKVGVIESLSGPQASTGLPLLQGRALRNRPH